MQSLAYGCAHTLRPETSPSFSSSFWSDSDALEPSGGGETGVAQLPQAEAGAAGALNLDTSTLVCGSISEYRPTIISPSEKGSYSGKPINYPEYERTTHIRAKVQPFTNGGYEVTICPINLQRIAEAPMRNRRRGPRLERFGDEESQQKSRYRSKRMVRLRCKEMGADHMLTFTTRATITLGALRKVWNTFYQHLYRKFGRPFAYVCVVERHPTNPDHLHLHAAIRGRLTPRELVVMRRCWYVALGGSEDDRGQAVRGGLNVREIRVRGGALARMDKIAAYLSKYLTKVDVVGFNEKRYWSSKIDLPAARSYWLRAWTMEDALIEVVTEYGLSPVSFKNCFFQTRNKDLMWFKHVPDPDTPYVVPF